MRCGKAGVCSRPSLALRAGLSLQPLAGERHPSRLSGTAWSPRLSIPAWLLSYRLVLALFMLAISIWSISSVPEPRAKWLIYLTHWGVLAVTAHALYAAALVLHVSFMGQPEHTPGLHWSTQIYWVLYNMAGPVAFMITIFYWALLYGSEFDDSGVREEDDSLEATRASEAVVVEASARDGVPAAATVALNAMVHAVNSVVMLLEAFLVALPPRLLHFYQPLCFGLCYVIFNAVFYLTGGTDFAGNRFIYSMVDWANPGPTIGTILLTALLLLATHGVTILVAILRDVIAHRLYRETHTETHSTGHSNPAYKHDV